VDTRRSLAIMSTPTPPITWLTKKEAAAHAKVSEKTIDRAMARGELTKFLAGRGIRLRKDQIDGWLEAQEPAATTTAGTDPVPPKCPHCGAVLPVGILAA
jgi:excisionase family DNA binding protein